MRYPIGDPGGRADRPVTTFIFTMEDPRDGRIRCVGRSSDPTARLRQDLHDARDGELGPKNDWLRILLKAGIRPEVVIIEAVEDPNRAASREGFWFTALSRPRASSR